jgi:hypothetical protein
VAADRGGGIGHRPQPLRGRPRALRVAAVAALNRPARRWSVGETVGARLHCLNKRPRVHGRSHTPALAELGASPTRSRGLSLRQGDAKADSEPVGALGHRPERERSRDSLNARSNRRAARQPGAVGAAAVAQRIEFASDVGAAAFPQMEKGGVTRSRAGGGRPPQRRLAVSASSSRDPQGATRGGRRGEDRPGRRRTARRRGPNAPRDRRGAGDGARRVPLSDGALDAREEPAVARHGVRSVHA